MRRREQDSLWLLIDIFCGGGLFQFGGGSIRSLGSLVMTQFNSRGWLRGDGFAGMDRDQDWHF